MMTFQTHFIPSRLSLIAPTAQHVSFQHSKDLRYGICHLSTGVSGRIWDRHLSSRHGCIRKEMRHGIHQLFRHEWIRKERTGQNKNTSSQKASISTVQSNLASCSCFITHFPLHSNIPTCLRASILSPSTVPKFLEPFVWCSSSHHPEECLSWWELWSDCLSTRRGNKATYLYATGAWLTFPLSAGMFIR